MHDFMSKLLISIAQVFIRWSNYHYKKVIQEQPLYVVPTAMAAIRSRPYDVTLH